MPNSFCLSAHHKLNLCAVETCTDTEGSSSQHIDNPTNQKDTSGNQIENITVSRPPPWRRHSIYAQQPPAGDKTGATPAPANNRVPPLAQHQQLEPQPPENDTHDFKNAKKRPNFKEDPTGYLGSSFIRFWTDYVTFRSEPLTNNSLSFSRFHRQHQINKQLSYTIPY